MESTMSNFTSQSNTRLTEEDLMKAFEALEETEKKRLTDIEYKPSWFEKFMNKHGWYRRQAVIVVDSQMMKNSIIKSFMQP